MDKIFDNKLMEANSGAAVGILYFLISCLIYVFIAPKNINTNAVNRYFLQWSLLIVGVIIQLSINWQTMRQICNKSASMSGLIMTSLVPWLLVFGTILVLITVFNGWLQPFSNTIGYYLVYNFGNLANVWDACFKDRGDAKALRDKGNVKNADTIDKILNQSWLIINNIPPNKPGFEQFWMEAYDNNLLAEGETATSFGGTKGSKLYQLLAVKRTISEFMWFSLIGVLTILISNNLVLEETCNLSPEDIENNIQKAKAQTNQENNERDDSVTFYDYGH